MQESWVSMIRAPRSARVLYPGSTPEADLLLLFASNVRFFGMIGIRPFIEYMRIPSILRIFLMLGGVPITVEPLLDGSGYKTKSRGSENTCH